MAEQLPLGSAASQTDRGDLSRGAESTLPEPTGSAPAAPVDVAPVAVPSPADAAPAPVETPAIGVPDVPSFDSGEYDPLATARVDAQSTLGEADRLRAEERARIFAAEVKDPASYAEDYNASVEWDVPMDVAKTEQFKKFMDAQAIPLEELRKTQPAVYKFVMDNQHNAAVTKGDYSALSAISDEMQNTWRSAKEWKQLEDKKISDWAVSAGVQSRTQQREYDNAVALITGIGTPLSDKELAQMDEMNALAGVQPTGDDSIFDQVVGNAITQAPNMFGTYEYAAAGYALGAVPTLLAGEVAGAALAPSTGGFSLAAPLPAAHAAGMATANMGMLYSSFKMETSDAAQQFRHVKDINGNPVDQRLAAQAAMVYGLVAMIPDYLATKNLMGKALAVDAVKNSMLKQFATTQSVKMLLANPTAARSSIKVVLDLLGAAGLQGSTEFLQRGLMSLTQKGMGIASDQELVAEDGKQALSEMFAEGRAAWYSSLGFGFIPLPINISTSITQAQNAVVKLGQMKKLTNAISASETGVRSRGVMQNFLNSISPDRKVGIAPSAITALRAEGKTSQEILDTFGAMGITPAQIEEAMVTGSDMEADASKVFFQLGEEKKAEAANKDNTATPAKNKLDAMLQHVRLDRKDITVFESVTLSDEDMAAKVEAQIEQLAPISAAVQEQVALSKQVYTTRYEQVIALKNPKTGKAMYTPQQADYVASLASGTYRKLALSAGVNPVELANHFNTQIVARKYADKPKSQSGTHILSAARELGYGGDVQSEAAQFLQSSLPRDTPSREARAVAQRYLVDAAHSTNAAEDFTEFEIRNGDLGMHFGSPKQANDRIKGVRKEQGKGRRDGHAHERVIPVKLRLDNPIRTMDAGDWTLASSVLNQMNAAVLDANPENPLYAKFVAAMGGEVMLTEARKRAATTALMRIIGENQKIVDDATAEDAWMISRIRGALQSIGVDGVTYVNAVEGKAGDAQNVSYIVFEPVQARSIFAMFDPDQAANPNMLAQPFDGSEVATTPLTDADMMIDVDGVQHPVRNSDGQLIHWSAEGVRNFWRWFGDSKVVDDQGRPIVMYHGTTADVLSFDKKKASSESDLGAGFYFTNTVEDVGGNYAGEGADLTNKIQREAERIADETDRKYSDADVISEAKAKFKKHLGVVMPVYLASRKPVVIGGRDSTEFTYTEEYNEETDSYAEPKGTLIKLVDALRDIKSEGNFYNLDAEEAISAMYETLDGYDSVTAEKIIEALKSPRGMPYTEDSNGNMAVSEVIRMMFERAGYDGIIDNTVNDKFGDARRYGKPMGGVNSDTVHIVMFKPTRIKSAIGNTGDFNPRKKSILNQPSTVIDDNGVAHQLTYNPAAMMENNYAPAYGVAEGNSEGLNDVDVLPESKKDIALQIASSAVARVKTHKIRSIKTDATDVRYKQDAVNVLAYLREMPQENFVVMVADKNGKPLQIIRHALGGIASSNVKDLGLLVGAALQVKGADNVWMAHNHPSGVAIPSIQDRRFQEHAEPLFRAAGLSVNGHIVIGDTSASVFDGTDELAQRVVDEPVLLDKTRNVSVVEREYTTFDRFQKKDVITTPRAAIELAERATTEGVLLLDNDNAFIGFVPVSEAERAELKNTKTLQRLLKAVHTTNTASAIVVSHNGMQGANNLATALANYEVSVLDVIYRDTSVRDPAGEYAPLRSASEAGTLIAESNGVFRQDSYAQLNKEQQMMRWGGVTELIDEDNMDKLQTGVPAVVLTYHGTDHGGYLSVDEGRLRDDGYFMAMQRELARTYVRNSSRPDDFSFALASTVEEVIAMGMTLDKKVEEKFSTSVGYGSVGVYDTEDEANYSALYRYATRASSAANDQVMLISQMINAVQSGEKVWVQERTRHGEKQFNMAVTKADESLLVKMGFAPSSLEELDAAMRRAKRIETKLYALHTSVELYDGDESISNDEYAKIKAEIDAKLKRAYLSSQFMPQEVFVVKGYTFDDGDVMTGEEMIAAWNSGDLIDNGDLSTIYTLAARLRNPMVVDAKGANWNAIKTEEYRVKDVRLKDITPQGVDLFGEVPPKSTQQILGDAARYIREVFDTGMFPKDDMPIIFSSMEWDETTEHAIELHPVVKDTTTPAVELWDSEDYISEYSSQHRYGVIRAGDPDIKDAPVLMTTWFEGSVEQSEERSFDTIEEALADYALQYETFLQPTMNTRQLVREAKDMGYDSLVIRNVDDNGGGSGDGFGDVVISFDANKNVKLRTARFETDDEGNDVIAENVPSLLNQLDDDGKEVAAHLQSVTRTRRVVEMLGDVDTLIRNNEKSSTIQFAMDAAYRELHQLRSDWKMPSDAIARAEKNRELFVDDPAGMAEFEKYIEMARVEERALKGAMMRVGLSYTQMDGDLPPAVRAAKMQRLAERVAEIDGLVGDVAWHDTYGKYQGWGEAAVDALAYADRSKLLQVMNDFAAEVFADGMENNQKQTFIATDFDSTNDAFSDLEAHAALDIKLVDNISADQANDLMHTITTITGAEWDTEHDRPAYILNTGAKVELLEDGYHIFMADIPELGMMFANDDALNEWVRATSEGDVDAYVRDHRNNAYELMERAVKGKRLARKDSLKNLVVSTKRGNMNILVADGSNYDHYQKGEANPSDPRLDAAASDSLATKWRKGAERLIKSRDAERRAALEAATNKIPSDPMVLNAPSDTRVPRGQIDISDPTQLRITLFEGANMSTLLHEQGHEFMQVLKYISTLPDISEQQKRDNAAVLEFVGATSFDTITREGEERFADGMLNYLHTGEAPTMRLLSAFRAFRKWLMPLFAQAKIQKINITPEVRGVFDRMIALDDEITLKQQNDQLYSGFLIQSLDLPPEDRDAYMQEVAQVAVDARDNVGAAAMEEAQIERNREYIAEKEKAKEVAIKELRNLPEYQAWWWIAHKQKLDGTALEGNHAKGLDYDTTLAAYGADYVAVAKAQKWTSAQGEKGITMAELAAIVGLDEAQLASTLVSPNAKTGQLDALPRIEEAAEQVASDSMRDAYGDITADEDALSLVADKALRTASASQLIEHEMAILRKMSRKIKNEIDTPLSILKEYARWSITHMPSNTIKAVKFAENETRAAMAAQQALLVKSDPDLAMRHKRQQYFEHQRFLYAITAQKDFVKNEAKLKKLGKDKKLRTRVRQGGKEYIDALDAHLSRFGVSSQPVSADAPTLTALMIKVKDDLAIDLPIADWLVTTATSGDYRALSPVQLKDVTEAATIISKAARAVWEGVVEGNKKSMEERKVDLVKSIYENNKVLPQSQNRSMTDAEEGASKRKLFFAQHTKLEFLFRRLDGNQNMGTAWHTFFEPFVRAENEEQIMMRDAATTLKDILFNRFSKKEWLVMKLEKIAVPEFGGMKYTNEELFAVLLNMGNETNKSRVLTDLKVDESVVMDVLHQRLNDARYWDSANLIWSWLDATYWDKLAAMQERIVGTSPQKVAAVPFTGFNGMQMRGGYYPIVFDSKRSMKAYDFSEKQALMEIEVQSTKAKAQDGHRQARVDGKVNMPLLLNLGVLARHVRNVSHDITHTPALIDTYRIARDPRVQQAIIDTAGREMYMQIVPWIQGIANDYREDNTMVDRIAMAARHNTTVVTMGLKLTTAMVQPLGYTMSLDFLNNNGKQGTKYALKAARKVLATPASVEANFKFMTERSEQMAHRMTSFDRDVRDIMKNLEPDAWRTQLENAAFWMTGHTDMGVSMATWFAAYAQAMDGNANNVEMGDETGAIEYADSAVRLSQGVGSAKDLAAIQRGGGLPRLMTMFYSYWSLVGNVMGERTRQFENNQIDTLGFMSSMILTWFLPAVLEQLMRDGGLGDDDDEKEKNLIKLGTSLAIYPFQAYVGVREATNYAANKILGRMGDYRLTPAEEAVATTGNLLADLVDDAAHKEFRRKTVKDAVMTAGYWGGLPSRQVWSTTEYTYDLLTGEESADDPFHVVRGMTVGLNYEDRERPKVSPRNHDHAWR